jgi:hypothetical protein
MVKGSWLRVQALGLQVKGVGFNIKRSRVYGLGLRV